MSHNLKQYKADENFGNGLVYSIPEVEKVLAEQDKEIRRLLTLCSNEDNVKNEADEQYYSLKKLCNNEIYQFKRPAEWDKNKMVDCGHWVFSEDYALSKKDFRLYWHTPGVMDGGIYCEAEITHYDKDRLSVKLHQDGFIYMGMLHHAELNLERFRNRMICVSVGELTNKIKISWFDDPEYVLWTVQYLDKESKEHLVNVRARTKNEAKVVAWADSCYKDEAINPEQFLACKYNNQVLTMGNSKANHAVLENQIFICDEYDEEDEATKPD